MNGRRVRMTKLWAKQNKKIKRKCYRLQQAREYLLKVSARQCVVFDLAKVDKTPIVASIGSLHRITLAIELNVVVS